MSIMPNQSPRSGMPPVVRKILFWLILIALAVVLWQLASVPGTLKHPNHLVDVMAAIIVIGVWIVEFFIWRKSFTHPPPPKDPENRPLG